MMVTIMVSKADFNQIHLLRTKKHWWKPSSIDSSYEL
ncbi:hypothetical protein CPS_1241 [Colwellia psychrerythraea 34H]|uniref:Uncharacterized protein n=1 Tax=Colwellia psychrerythraea (strain 34H / ATCC BAA-681) TaxID=167879 RepID=Q486N1_COLP3|nr:hypothetical protein CPS_1241 [Colwellia psychrerythraea 34H]